MTETHLGWKWWDFVQVKFLEQVFHGLFRQLDTHDLVPPINQPTEIDALAAQWHEDATNSFWQQAINVTVENRVDFIDVKLNVAFLPACKPTVPIFRR